MKDRYPDYTTIPAGYLVEPAFQPDYTPLPGRQLADDANLATAILGAAPADVVAIRHHESGRVDSYGDLEAATLRVAGGMVSAGIRPGERVAFRASNRTELVVTALAAWRVGAIVVPIPVQTSRDELRFYLEDTEPRLLFGSVSDRDDPSFLETSVRGTSVERVVLFDPVDRPPGERWDDWLSSEPCDHPTPPADSVAIVWHTGGTTGRPKACYHTHRRFLLGGYACADALGTGPGARWLAAAPLGHGLGLICNTIYTLLHGAQIVLVERYSRPDVVLEAIETHQVDTLMALTVTWARMLDVLEHDDRYDLSSLQHGFAMWQSASSAHVRDAWLARGIELLNNFGSTSFATWVLVPRPGDNAPPRSLGRAAPGYRVEAIDPENPSPTPLPAGTPGRMAVRGPTGLTYWNRPDLQRRDVSEGWTLVDDLICLDADGYADYLGRTDYLISTSGFKVAPVEVEQVLSEHPAVKEVAVIGLPDTLRQEIVAAYVVLHNGTPPDPTLEQDLHTHATNRLSTHKCPRRYTFIDALPRDPVGKVQPRLLAQLEPPR